MVIDPEDLMDNSYEIYSDESGSGEDRFEAIGTISGDSESTNLLREELHQILSNYNLSHCEYKKITGGLRFNCAIDFITAMHRYVVQGRVKVMVLVWDKQDKRHDVVGRDDIANVSIMYYWALKTTKRQWLDVTIDSDFFPDELTKIDFNQIISYIENTRIRDRSSMNTLFGNEFVRMFPVVRSHRETISSSEPLTQLIDILTGMVRLSYEEKESFTSWREQYNAETTTQGSLFVIDIPKIVVSKNKSHKYRLIHEVDALFKGDSMQVALRSEAGFLSKRPSNGYFFWKYDSQHSEDKAPVKQR